MVCDPSLPFSGKNYLFITKGASIMAVHGVNRVLIAVHDLEASKLRYSELLGATFFDAHWTGEPFGISVSISWDAGIELCAPLPGREKNCAVSQFLEQRGEGVMSVFFAVDNVEDASKTAQMAGVDFIHSLSYTSEEIDTHLGGMFSRYEEVFFNTSNEFGTAFGIVDIRPKNYDLIEKNIEDHC